MPITDPLTTDSTNFIYRSACRSNRKEVVDPIYDQSLRIVLGAFKFFPVDSLYVKANETPL